MLNRTDEFQKGRRLQRELVNLWDNNDESSVKRIQEIVNEMYLHYKTDNDVYDGFIYNFQFQPLSTYIKVAVKEYFKKVDNGFV
jgi:hypothetical protein